MPSITVIVTHALPHHSGRHRHIPGCILSELLGQLCLSGCGFGGKTLWYHHYYSRGLLLQGVVSAYLRLGLNKNFWK